MNKHGEQLKNGAYTLGVKRLFRKFRWRLGRNDAFWMTLLTVAVVLATLILMQLLMR
ncbi:hypothetical protein SAMN00790413_03822 [Deinococcus hopiensis KR-140]|uniref:Uncharacterized protein n=1 Tax=Deinococcus hopiensis KR-140 TaxID=695939 RepID=A0A1W1UZE2_9DEIO|nr:hypothetical protein SAMN00790413_03822 [Deinococcus hopiensis KR-140]